MSLIFFLLAYASFCWPLCNFTALQYPFFFSFLFIFIVCYGLCSKPLGLYFTCCLRQQQNRAALQQNSVAISLFCDDLMTFNLIGFFFFFFCKSITIWWFLQQLEYSWEHRKSTPMKWCWSQNLFLSNYIENTENFPVVVPVSPPRAQEHAELLSFWKWDVF